MTFAVSEETQQLIEARMKEFGISSLDTFLQGAVCQYDPSEVFYYEDLDEETRAAIEVADRQEGIPWEQVKDELLKRYGGK